jgi:hypothetical protein
MNFLAMAPDGSAYGWCNASGQCVVEISGQPRNPDFASRTLNVGPASSIAFGPQAKLLAVGGEGMDVHLWNLAAKIETKKLTALGKATRTLLFSADGNTLVAVAADGTSICVFDLSRNTTRRFQHNFGEVGALALSPDGKTLATTPKDSKTLYLLSTTARQLSHKGPPVKMSGQQLAALYNELANADLDKADNAWQRLGAAGDLAIPMLRAQIRLVAVPPADVKRIEKLVAELDSENFATRNQAIAELGTVGEVAVVPLERFMEKPPSEEARERAKLLLKKLGEPAFTPDRLRVLEAIELLERLGTANAITLLEEIERDALIAPIHREARQALQRMGRFKEVR